MNLALGSFHLLVLLIQSMVNPTGLPAYIGYVALSVMLSVLLGIFNAGTALYYLNILCGQPFSLQDLFWGFKDPSGKCLKISAVISLADLFFSIPSLYFSYLFMTTPGHCLESPSLFQHCTGGCVCFDASYQPDAFPELLSGTGLSSAFCQGYHEAEYPENEGT